MSTIFWKGIIPYQFRRVYLAYPQAGKIERSLVDEDKPDLIGLTPVGELIPDPELFGYE
jgi:hypothetical protein